MKGLELPINVMIIVVLAIIILIAVMALFMGVWGPSSENVNLAAVKNGGCQKYVSLNYCDTPNDGTSITTSTVTCKCAETDIGTLGGGKDGADPDTDVNGNTWKEDEFKLNLLGQIAACCYGTSAYALCCF